MKKTGFYIIKDSFFDDMDEPYLKGNKKGNRPHYYCFEDSASGLYWMIPLSSRIDKYKKIVENKKKAGKRKGTIEMLLSTDDNKKKYLHLCFEDAYMVNMYQYFNNNNSLLVRTKVTLSARKFVFGGKADFENDWKTK